MARHRSPRGRRAHQGTFPPAIRRAAGDAERARRPAYVSSPLRPTPLRPTPLRRGAAVVAVSGTALSLIGAAAPGGISGAPAAGAAPRVGTTSTAVSMRAPSRVEATDPAEVDEVVLRPPVEPVIPEPGVLDVGELVKAAQLTEQAVTRAEEERRLAEERAAQEKAAQERSAREKATREKAARPQSARPQSDRPQSAREAAPAPVVAAAGSSDCGLGTSGLGAVKAHVRAAATFLGCRFDEPDMYGVAGRGGPSDHPKGLAVDFMVNRATGDALADCALRNKQALGITYVIWRQRINHGGGWKPMADRGGVTANHFDHVHISFAPGGGGGATTGC